MQLPNKRQTPTIKVSIQAAAHVGLSRGVEISSLSNEVDTDQTVLAGCDAGLGVVNSTLYTYNCLFKWFSRSVYDRNGGVEMGVKKPTPINS